MNGNNTIEPRFIALLTDASSSLELPPLQNQSNLKPSGRLPLQDLDIRTLNKKFRIGLQLDLNQTTVLLPVDEESRIKNHDKRPSLSMTELLVGDSSRQSLSKILDDNDCSNLNSVKKSSVDLKKDDFLQLPQLPKKQKTTKQVVPPIIIGLFQPPPQSTLFPPISSSFFKDNCSGESVDTIPRNLKLSKEGSDERHVLAKPNYSASTDRIKKSKNVAARKKWTEEETNNLLLGVYKHGVGCWSDILSDSSFVFNNRSSSDLKDRWRTCCPDEFRGNTSSGSITMKKGTICKTRSGLTSDKILTQDENNLSGYDINTVDFTTSLKKRSHRKKLEDLLQLGIEGPLRQSNRRKRRQFTEDEDRALLEGYNYFGPSWSKIQKDPRLKLHSRQPTDLRDRFRNKFRDRFRQDKGKTSSPLTHKTNRRSKDTLGPSQKDANKWINQISATNMSIKLPQPMLQTFPNRDGLRIQEIILSEPLDTLEDQPSIDPVEGLPFSQFTDWSQGTNTTFSNIIGEMDISRLLLDETWSDMHQDKEKQISSDVNSLLSTGLEPLHHLPSFFSTPTDPDDLTVEPFG